MKDHGNGDAAIGWMCLIGWLILAAFCMWGGLPVWLGVLLGVGVLLLAGRIIERRDAVPIVPRVRVSERCEPWLSAPPAQGVEARMFGVPGGGLASAVSVFGVERVEAGVEGERRLSDVLAAHGCFDALVFRSLTVPDMGDVDVDCAVLDGRILWLLDAKLWTFEPGCAWTRHGATVEGGMVLRHVDENGCATGPIAAERRLSRSMVMAVESYRRLFPGLDVRACTLLVPSDRGVAAVASDAVTPEGSLLETVYSWLDVYGRSPHAMPDMGAARRLMGLLNG